MSVKIISYDLGGPETSASYRSLIGYIKSLGNWAKPLESYWLVETYSGCEQIVAGARPFLDQNDKLLVIEASLNSWWSKGLDQEVIVWMKRR